MQQQQQNDIEIPTITNARFLDIGFKQVVAGTLDGKSFYSEPVLESDGEIIVTRSATYRISRSI